MKLPDDLQDAISQARAKVHLRYPWWLRVILMRGVVAITIGRRIYVAADVAEQHLEQLLRHELVHVRQVGRLGLLRFYWRYLAEFVALRRRGLSAAEAYRNISFEREAVAAEKIL